MSKDLMKHRKFAALAKREDDLKFVLLTYGKQLGSALKPVQKEFRKAVRACDRLAKILEKKGYLYYG
jgi:hypothetical protein